MARSDEKSHAKIISSNVFKYMTFGAGNRAMRSIDPCPKCGGDKTA